MPFHFATPFRQSADFALFRHAYAISPGFQLMPPLSDTFPPPLFPQLIRFSDFRHFAIAFAIFSADYTFSLST
jgi:hypothetical protein